MIIENVNTEEIQSIERDNIGSIQSIERENTGPAKPIRKDNADSGDLQEKVPDLSTMKSVTPGLSEMRNMTTKDLLNLFEITIQSWGEQK